MSHLFPDLAPRFRTISIDFPWEERGGGKIKRGADRHYPLVPSKDGPALIRSSGLFLPFDDAHLYFWTTDTFLANGDALTMVKALGFRPVRTIAWVKMNAKRDDVRIGLGQYFRGCHELMIFAVRGKGQIADVCTGRRDLKSVIAAPHPSSKGKRIHSRKPVEAYELIEARSKGPYLEMFARTGREGWTAWGNEAPAACPLGLVSTLDACPRDDCQVHR